MRKILHIDMDCFYAAIEVRDHPELQGKPVAVGGRGRRGVLTTASYEAREFGCHSAMPTFRALELCPQLTVMRPRFEVYSADSRRIREVFGRFTELVEPLSLDEAFLDVSHLQSQGISIAWEIRSQIREEIGLTASAGIAPNKLLAKIASDWRKPDGQFEVTSENLDSFMQELPVKRLYGVGRKMEERLASIGVTTCGHLQRLEKVDLASRYGRWGVELYDLCRGLDERLVRTNRIRKSVSSESTFRENIEDIAELIEPMHQLRSRVEETVQDRYRDRIVKSLVIKLKFSDFNSTTVERAPGGPSEKGEIVDPETCRQLLEQGWDRRKGRAVRLLGVGVRFADPDDPQQLDLGFESDSVIDTVDI